MKEGLKNHPVHIPEDHFKQLIVYWKNTTIQVYNYWLIWFIEFIDWYG